MKARAERPRRSRAKSPFLVVGAVVGTLPALHASDHRQAALPVERRITLEPARLEAALAHVRIWTPSETLPVFSWQDTASGSAGATADDSRARSRFPPGPLDGVLKTFETVTGVTVALAEDGIGALPSPGVTGVLYRRAGAGRAPRPAPASRYRFTDATAVTVEIRVDADAVQVSGALPRVESTEVRRAARRNAADDPGHSAHAPRRAGRDDADRRAAQRAGHHDAGGRRRRRLEHERRHVQHARLLGQQQPLRRRRARRRADRPRRLQPRADRSVLRADRIRRRPDQRRRLHQPRRPRRRNLESAQAGTLSYGAGEQVRATIDVNQPVALRRRAGRSSAAPRSASTRSGRTAAPPAATTPSRESKSIAPSIAFGLSTPTRASLSAQIMRQDNLADYGLPAAASPIGPLAPTSVRRGAAGRPVQLLRQPRLRLRPGRAGQRHAARRARLRADPDAAQPDALQHDDARGGHHEHRQSGGVRPGRRISSRSAVRPTTRHNDIFSNQTNLTRPRDDRPAAPRAQRRDWRFRARASPRRRWPASARAPRSTSTGPTSSARSSA